jgi:hypothetical protein
VTNVREFSLQVKLTADDWRIEHWKSSIRELNLSDDAVTEYANSLEDLHKALSMIPIISFQTIQPLIENRKLGSAKFLHPYLSKDIITLIGGYHFGRVKLTDNIEEKVNNYFLDESINIQSLDARSWALYYYYLLGHKFHDFLPRDMRRLDVWTKKREKEVQLIRSGKRELKLVEIETILPLLINTPHAYQAAKKEQSELTQK